MLEQVARGKSDLVLGKPPFPVFPDDLCPAAQRRRGVSFVHDSALAHKRACPHGQQVRVADLAVRPQQSVKQRQRVVGATLKVVDLAIAPLSFPRACMATARIKSPVAFGG